MSNIDFLTSQASRLEDSFKWWNHWYIVLAIVTATVTGILVLVTVVFQKVASSKSEALVEATKKLDSAKDLQRDEQIAKVRADSDFQVAQIKADSDQKIAAANRRSDEISAESNRQAAELGKQNLATEARLTEANTRLEQEGIKRLELERSIAPREMVYITYPDKTSNTDALRKFVGMQFVIEYLPDSEPSRAAFKIVALLENSGWTKLELRPRSDINNAAFDGVHVLPYRLETIGNLGRRATLDELGWGKAGDAADALIEFLLSLNWVAEMGVGPAEDIPPQTVKVIVGAKPDPYFQPQFVKDAMEMLRKAREQSKISKEKQKAFDEEIRKRFSLPPPENQ